MGCRDAATPRTGMRFAGVGGRDGRSGGDEERFW